MNKDQKEALEFVLFGAGTSILFTLGIGLICIGLIAELSLENFIRLVLVMIGVGLLSAMLTLFCVISAKNQKDKHVEEPTESETQENSRLLH